MIDFIIYAILSLLSFISNAWMIGRGKLKRRGLTRGQCEVLDELFSEIFRYVRMNRTMFRHPGAAQEWLSGLATTIYQYLKVLNPGTPTWRPIADFVERREDDGDF